MERPQSTPRVRIDSVDLADQESSGSTVWWQRLRETQVPLHARNWLVSIHINVRFGSALYRQTDSRRPSGGEAQIRSNSRIRA